MSQIFVLYLLSLTIRSLLIGLIAGLILRGSTKVHVRHAVWTSVLFVVFLMPIADAVLPPAMVPAAVPEVFVPIQTFIVSAPPPDVAPLLVTHPATLTQSTNWWQMAAIAMILVAFVLLLRLSIVFRAVAQIRKTSRVISTALWDELRVSQKPLFRTISLRESDAVTVPLTIGLRKPLLILPVSWRDWDAWKLRAVLTHELTHVRRLDWAITAAAALARCLFWFNPLVWWLERKLSLLAEQASDEACVRSSGDRQRYAETLLHFATAAKHGHRWIGGIAMAQPKISLRIERVLALKQPGSGILQRAAWATLFAAALPALYLSAATQSERAANPLIPTAEIRQLFERQVPPPVRTAMPEQAQPPAGTPVSQPQAAAQQGAPATVEVPATPVQPSQLPNNPNPDLVGEIRLILTPVDGRGEGGGIQFTTAEGTTRYSGTAVWNIRNSALPPAFWGSNNAYAFSVTGVEGRKILFEDSTGSTFSYGCADCSFLVWESGVGLPSANGAGVVFHLSGDGKTLSATCRATECRLAVGNGTFFDAYTTLRNSETSAFGLLPVQPSANQAKPGLICFSVFGNVKADGTPFTQADCPSGSARLPPSTLLFSVTR